MRERFTGVVAALTCVVAVALAVPAWAGDATDALRGHIDRIFGALDDPSLKGEEQAGARHRALRALAEDAVDFSEAARRTLEPHWNERTAAERAYFVRLFTDLIDHGYLGRLSRGRARIEYDDEAVAGMDAAVRARAIAGSGDGTSVLFTLHRGSDARWRIVDVSVGGMSLVGSYRAQFARIIRATSYEGLVTRLEERTRFEGEAGASTREAPAP